MSKALHPRNALLTQLDSPRAVLAPVEAGTRHTRSSDSGAAK